MIAAVAHILMSKPAPKAGLILVCTCITAVTLNQFAGLVQHLLSIPYDWKFEFCMVIGQLVFQLLFIYKNSLRLQLDYFLNMVLVSCMGAVLLWPLLAVNHFYPLSAIVNLTCFFGVVLFMFFEHKRRVSRLGLPAFISYTWVLYRLIILIFIL